MSWIYSQSTGQLTHNDDYVATGYSGSLKNRNDPTKQHQEFDGPIPRGHYTIAAPRDSENTGAYVLELTPIDHDAKGRDDFQIHGDNDSNNASTGCIILELKTRQHIVSSGDNELIVIR